METNNLENLTDEKINGLVREFILMSVNPDKYFSNSKNNNSNLEFVKNASSVFTAISKSVDTWVSFHPDYTIKKDNGRKERIRNYLNKDIVNNSSNSKERVRIIKYIDRLGYLMSVIPKVDENFKDLIRYFIKAEFSNNLRNVCVNENMQDTREDYYKLFPQYDFSFEGLKNTYDNYYLRKDDDGFNVYTMDEVKCLDPLIVDRVKFASTWMVCAGVKSGGGNRYSKDSLEYQYAFNEGARDLYYNIMNTAQEEMLRDGHVDMLDIKNSISKHYKYNDIIINNIFNSDRYIESLEKWMIHSIDNSFDFANYKNNNNSNIK